jgi:hypothetical protein
MYFKATTSDETFSSDLWAVETETVSETSDICHGYPEKKLSPIDNKFHTFDIAIITILMKLLLESRTEIWTEDCLPFGAQNWRSNLTKKKVLFKINLLFE